eukprot:GDKK01018972.1.p1 GENE.GDKK01018972.1~~GDKK01018972.1.p1  ORF type:complete len:327 (+),score=45.18 GDKK01018972.1:115-981(+)
MAGRKTQTLPSPTTNTNGRSTMTLGRPQQQQQPQPAAQPARRTVNMTGAVTPTSRRITPTPSSRNSSVLKARPTVTLQRSNSDYATQPQTKPTGRTSQFYYDPSSANNSFAAQPHQMAADSDDANNDMLVMSMSDTGAHDEAQIVDLDVSASEAYQPMQSIRARLQKAAIRHSDSIDAVVELENKLVDSQHDFIQKQKLILARFEEAHQGHMQGKPLDEAKNEHLSLMGQMRALAHPMEHMWQELDILMREEKEYADSLNLLKAEAEAAGIVAEEDECHDDDETRAEQ